MSDKQEIQKDESEFIEIVDDFGRRLSMRREDWRKNAVGNLNAAQDFYKLFGLINGVVRDGLFQEALEASPRLVSLAPNVPTRGDATALWAYALRRMDRPIEAERLLLESMKRFEASASMLAGLGFIAEDRGDLDAAIDWLGKSARKDPNISDTVYALFRTLTLRDGETAAREAVEQLEEIPGAWVPQTIHAEQLLRENLLRPACEIYRRVIRERSPLPLWIYRQIERGLILKQAWEPLVTLLRPEFDVARMGIEPAFGLIQAYLGLRDVVNGRALIESAYAACDPLSRHKLDYWDGEIGKLELELAPAAPTSGVQLISMPAPFWTRRDCEVKPLSRNLRSPRVGFLSGLVAYPPEAQGKRGFQTADRMGFASRAFPCLLAHHLATQQRIDASVVCLAVNFRGLGVFSPCTIEEALRLGEDFDFVVDCAVIAESSQANLRFRLLDVQNRSKVDEWSSELNFEALPQGLPEVLDDATEFILKGLPHAKVGANLSYKQGSVHYVSAYMDCLCKSMSIKIGVYPEGVSWNIFQERAMMGAFLHLAANFPTDARSRLTMLSAFEEESRRRPRIVGEFFADIERFLARHSAPEGFEAAEAFLVASIKNAVSTIQD